MKHIAVTDLKSESEHKMIIVEVAPKIKQWFWPYNGTHAHYEVDGVAEVRVVWEQVAGHPGEYEWQVRNLDEYKIIDREYVFGLVEQYLIAQAFADALNENIPR